ncbi:MAG TPA: glycosyltransferase family 4 protein [Ilumatobacteraceae bacterium]
MTGRAIRPSVLHVILKVQETNGQFNEHCVPLANRRDITVVSFLAPTLTAPLSIEMFAGDGGLRSGWRALRSALRSRRYDVVHVHAPQTGALLLAALGPLASRRANCIYTVQNSYRNYRLRNRMLMVPIFAAYPQVVFCSQAALDSMPRSLRWLVKDKAYVVPNAVDIAGIDRAISEIGHDHGDRFHLVVVGRMVPIKNMATVLEAVARTTADVDLTIIGDGPLRADLEAVVRGRPRLAPRVRFAGLLERADVHRALAQADLCVSASLGEGLPVAVLEAMACRTPVLLSDIAPHREIDLDRPELALVECHDVDGFAAAIDALASLPLEDRQVLGQRCRQIVEDRFGIAAMHLAYAPIYDAAARASAEPRIDLAW